MAITSSVRLVRGATFHVEQRSPAADDRNNGSEGAPWKTISRAASSAMPGDTVIIGNGVYRETVKLARGGTADQPIRFEAAPAATAIVTGTDRITRWTADTTDPTIFSTTWGYDFIGWNATHAHPDDDFHLLIGRCEQVFIGGQPLRQVLDRRQLTRGTFLVDFAAKRLYACSADGRKLTDDGIIAEASTRSVLWECTGDFVQTVGLRFRYAANPAQHGAATFTGKHDGVEDCTFERTNSSGASFAAEDIVVRHCTFCDNGQLGFGAARAHRLRITDCTIARNSVKGFSRDWEAGGDKIVLSRDAIIEKSIFIENHGSGIWFDIGNENCVVRNCLIENNEDAGIFDEISYGLRASDNVIYGNGLADTPGAWGAAGGICLSSSPNSVVERNLLIGNKEGFSFREANRTTPRIDAPPNSPEEKIWNHDEQVDHNLLAYNRDAQLRGWFDVDDQRNWPTAMQERKGEPTQPAMSLEALKLTLSDNLYAVEPVQTLFHWGVAWKRNKAYASLDEVRKELQIETRSAVEAVKFNRSATLDFRLPADAQALKLQRYPNSEVPGVLLGVMK